MYRRSEFCGHNDGKKQGKKLNIDCGFEGACKSGNLEVVKYTLKIFENMMEKYKHNITTPLKNIIFDKCMEKACKKDNINVIEFLISNGVVIKEKHIEIAKMYGYKEQSIYLENILAKVTC